MAPDLLRFASIPWPNALATSSSTINLILLVKAVRSSKRNKLLGAVVGRQGPEASACPTAEDYGHDQRRLAPLSRARVRHSYTPSETEGLFSKTIHGADPKSNYPWIRRPVKLGPASGQWVLGNRGRAWRNSFALITHVCKLYVDAVVTSATLPGVSISAKGRPGRQLLDLPCDRTKIAALIPAKGLDPAVGTLREFVAKH